MKSRLVVGPPPIKYEKKYKKGGKLPKYQTGGTLANPLSVKDDPWEYAQENGVVYTRKKGTDKWINLGSADDMTQLSSRNQMARTAILDKYGKQLGYSQSKVDKETNVLTEPVDNKSTKDEMVERVKASLATPEGQMKYRPATGKAEVTSSPIDFIAGGAKLGPLLIKTVGKLLIDTAKSQEKGLTKLPENKPSLKTETSIAKPTSGVTKYSPKGRTYNISGELPSGAKGLGEGMKTVGTGPKLKSGVKAVTDVINKEGKVIKSIYKYKYGGSLPKKQLGGQANVGADAQAGLGLLTAGVGAIPGVGAILAPIVGALGGAMLQNAQKKNNFNRQYSNIQVAEKGGKINKLGVENSLWNNIREKAKQNKKTGATPKKPTKEMLEQERKIKAKMEFGGMLTGKSDLSFYKGRKHANGGIMVSSKGTPSNKPVAEVEGGETRFKLGSNAYIFSDKLTL